MREVQNPALVIRALPEKAWHASVEFEGWNYFVFPMEHSEFSDTGLIGNLLRGTKEKGEESLKRFSAHLVRVLKDLEQVKIEVTSREWKDRV
jgi:creatinine amidohydrolase